MRDFLVCRDENFATSRGSKISSRFQVSGSRYVKC